MKILNIAVIGAGASGITAAIQSATMFEKSKTDYEITVFEHLSKAAKKILVTGNGRCNFTNTDITPLHYHGNTELIENVLNSNYSDIKCFFENAGVLTYCEDGRIYPRSQQAVSVRNALLNEVSHKKINILTDCKIDTVKTEKNKFLIDGKVFDALIFACGGISSKSQGTDGSAYPLIKSFGHTFTELKPSLTAFTSNDKDLKELKGIRVKGRLSLFCKNELLGFNNGEIQFTEKTVSGIPAFQLSYLYKKDGCYVNIDAIEDMNEKEITEHFLNIKTKKQYTDIETALSGILPEKLGYVIINRAKIKPRTPLKDLSVSDFLKIAFTAKNLKFELSGTRAFEDSQISAGGLNTKEIDTKTLMSLKKDGVFFCGEVLDVNGDCGGYNLHFAFTSGRIAGKSVYEYLTKKEL